MQNRRLKQDIVKSYFRCSSVIVPVLSLLVLMAGAVVSPHSTIAMSGLHPESSKWPGANVQPYDDDEVYRIVDEMPEIVGGIEALYEHLTYPERAVRARIQGRVIIQFIITEQGDILETEILRDIGGDCGQAAVKAIKKVTFTPGRQDGRAVPVLYALPVTFRIED